MNINIVKLNHEDENGVHLSKRAWSYSRTEDDSNEGDIIALNLPANEMPNAVLEIESTIMEREIIASMRDHHMWARSSRVDDPLQFKTPDVLRGNDEFTNLKIDSRALMMGAKNISRQDEYRLFLPLVALTKYTISINLRSLIILRNFFKDLYDSGVHRPNFPPVLILGAYRNLSNVIVKMTGSANLDRYPTVNILPEVREMTSGRVGGFITYSGTISFSLRTHLIRHRMLFMNDNLLEIIDSPTFDSLTLETPVKVNITSSIDFWKRIVSTRSCWLTHYAMWKLIIDEVSKYIDEGINDILPCSGGKCPFEVDNTARIEMKDPNPPCPIYLNENRNKVYISSPTYIEEMKKQLIEDERPKFWNKHIDEVEQQ